MLIVCSSKMAIHPGTYKIVLNSLDVFESERKAVRHMKKLAMDSNLVDVWIETL